MALFNREAVAASSPTLPQATLGKRRMNKPNPDGVEGTGATRFASLPDVPFIPFQVVTLEQRSQLILKTHLAMMVLLVKYILLNNFKIRRAHGEVRIAALPLEISNRMLLF